MTFREKNMDSAIVISSICITKTDITRVYIYICIHTHIHTYTYYIFNYFLLRCFINVSKIILCSSINCCTEIFLFYIEKNLLNHFLRSIIKISATLNFGGDSWLGTADVVFFCKFR